MSQTVKPRVFPPASETPKRGQDLYVCDECGTEFWMKAAADSAWCFFCWDWTSFSSPGEDRRDEVWAELRSGG